MSIKNLISAPKYAYILSKKVIVANSEEFYGKATNSIYFLKYSTITNTYLALHGMLIRNPKNSKYQW